MVKDHTKYFQTALQNAVSLAKKIGGSIDILSVKSPFQVINDENQLAALRELNKASGGAKMTMKETVDSIAEAENLTISYNFTFGNLITEVRQHIGVTQPDIIVLGKRKTNIANLLGLDLTSYLLKNYHGALLISRDAQLFGTQDGMALGMLNDIHSENRSKLSEDLEKLTDKPITLLKINNLDNGQVEPSRFPSDMTTFEFDHGANVSESFSKYIERSGVSLLCVRKSQLLDLNNKFRAVTKHIQKTIQKTNTPVLVLAS